MIHHGLELTKSVVLNKLLSIDQVTGNDYPLENLVRTIQDEQLKVKDLLIQRFYQLADESRVEFYFNDFQNTVTSLANILYDNLETNDTILAIPSDVPLTFCSAQISVLFIIEELLSYLETRFPKYFNQDALIPHRMRELAVRQFSDSLIDFGNDKDFCPEKLKLIITRPLNEFIEDPSTNTYRQVNYFRILLSEISNLREHNIEKAEEEPIYLKLIYLNFNSIAFFNWLTLLIRDNISRINSFCTKVERLSWYSKAINQTPEYPGISLCPHQKTIKQLLSEWTFEEVCHLEKIHSTTSLTSNPDSPSIENDLKIITDLSVPQLAFLLRTFVGTKLFNNKKPVALVTRTFARIMQTKGAEELSPENLRQDYYKPDVKTIETVKTAIIKILNYIQDFSYILILVNIVQDYGFPIADIIQ